MNNIWKRSLSMLLALVMVVGMLPMSVLAEEQETSNECVHEYAPGTPVDPTCTEAGYTVYTCGLCGDSYQDDAVEALGHDWGVWEPTEDETAEVRTCAACGETETYVYEDEGSVLTVAQADDTGDEEPAPADLAEAEGIVWMDKDKHNNSGNGYFKGQIMKGNLDNIIRKAVGLDYANEDIKVSYDGMNVGDIYALAVYQDKLNKLQDELTDAVSYHQLVTFNVNGTDMDIAFRNILTVSVAFPSVVIEGKAAPADLAAQVAAGLTKLQNEFVISHIFEISQEKAGAEVSASTNDYEWPEAGEEVVAAEVAVTIYDSVDGTDHTKYGEVVLKDTREVFTVTYKDADGSVLLSEDVVENEATPACNPTRTYYTLS